MSVGPWGGADGFRWDDGVYSGIRQLVVAHGAGIDSIHIEYDDRGISVWSDKHGGSGGLKTDKVSLLFTFKTRFFFHFSSPNNIINREKPMYNFDQYLHYLIKI